jgi:SlyX protein
MIDRRLVEIETKLAFQEDTLQALNLVMCRQQEQIDQLEQTCRLLLTRVQELAMNRDEAKPREEKPPHY